MNLSLIFPKSSDMYSNLKKRHKATGKANREGDNSHTILEARKPKNK